MKAFNPASGLIVTLISLTILGGLALSPQSIIAGPWVELTTPPGLQRWICYAGNTYLFVAGDEGLYRTPLSSPGIWESIGLAGMDLYCMVAGGEDDSFIMAGSRGADLMNRTTDGGESWITTSGSSEIRTVMLAWNGELPGRVYSYHWESSSYGSQHLVCVNTDFGAQWDCTWSHWNPAGEPYPCWVDYLAAPSDGSNNAYLGVTCNGCLGEQEMGSRKSTDGGATWFNLPGYLVQMIDQVSATTSSIDPQRLFVAIYDQIHKWQGDQYFGVESCGISTSSVISPRWAGGDLFVGGYIDTGLPAVRWSQTDGQLWTDISDGLPDEEMNYWDDPNLAAAWDHQLLFFMNPDIGLWKRTWAASDVETPADQSQPLVYLTQPWPNPTSGRAYFRVEGSATGVREIYIADLLGRRIKRYAVGEDLIYRGFQWDGRLENGRSAPAGIYFIRVLTNHGPLTKSLTLVR